MYSKFSIANIKFLFMFSSIIFNQLSFVSAVFIQFAVKSVTYTYLSKVLVMVRFFPCF